MIEIIDSDLASTLNDTVLTSLRTVAPLVAFVYRKTGRDCNALEGIVSILHASLTGTALRRLWPTLITAFTSGQRVVGNSHSFTGLSKIKPNKKRKSERKKSQETFLSN